MRKRLSKAPAAVRKRLLPLLDKINKRYTLTMSCFVAIENLVTTGAIDDAFMEKDEEILFLSVPEWKLRDAEVKRMVDFVNNHCGMSDEEVPLIVAGEMLGPPDGTDNSRVATWYGRGGRKSAESAIHVEYSGFAEYHVSQYQHMGSAGVEVYDEREPFMVETTALQAYGLRQAAAEGIKWLGEHGGWGTEYAAGLP